MPDTSAITILGSTGSIGRQALEVVGAHPERFRVVGLSAQKNLELLVSQCEQFKPNYAAIGDETCAKELRSLLPASIKILAGEAGLCELAALEDSGVVLGAISGMAGLSPVLAAVRAGKRVALANKEPLVAAGELITAEARRLGATLLPVDSEHSAIFQLLEGRKKEEICRILLTASGGPFLHNPADLSQITPQQALAHPTWKMGPKVTIDSATLMNKGLEIIEARWLFDTPVENIEVVIHPQSLIHSMIEFIDGALLAHLSPPDMRIPIQYALGYPERLAPPWSQLDLIKAGQLTFFSPDLARFPCLRLAREAAKIGGAAPAVMCAADEVAVERFLQGKIKFTDIPRLVESALGKHAPIEHPTLVDILATTSETQEKLQLEG